MRGVWLTLFLVWELCTRVSDASSCVNEMMQCTRQMTLNIAAANYRSLICGIMADYLNCIEYVCNTSLTSCEINKARNVIADLITDYGVRCAFYIPHYDDDCSLSSSPSSTSSTTAVMCLVFYVCCYILNLSLQ